MKQLNLDVNAVDEDGRTPLMLACRQGQGKAVEYLMQASASPDIKDHEGYAAVHFSVIGSVDRYVGISRASSTVRALAKYRANMDRKTVDGFTAVHLAVKLRATDIVGQLKAFGCNLDKFSTDGVNAFYLACHAAAEDKTVTPVISLIQLGAKIDSPDPVHYRTALHKACDEELSEIARFLVLSKASVMLQDKHGDTPLHICAKRGSTRTLEVICQALMGGEKMPSGNPAREKEDLEIKLAAVADEADEAKIRSIMSVPDPQGNTPLHIACSFGYENYVNMLMIRGANPETRTHNSGQSTSQGTGQMKPKSSKKKRRASVDDEPGNAPKSQAVGGQTAYHVAAEVGHTEIFKMFVRKGIDISGTDEVGGTCLHYAATNNDVEITALALESGLSADVQTFAGWTPLHYAAAYDSVHVIVLLLESQADVDMKNNQGHTPMMLAVRSRTKNALLGLLKQTLEREEKDRQMREQTMLEERKRVMEQLENDVALQRGKSKKPLVARDSDEEPDEEDPLARIKQDPAAAKETARADPERPASRPASARSGTGSTGALSTDRLSARTTRTSTSKLSLRSHPPPKDEKWARFKYDMKKTYDEKYREKVEKAMKPVKDKLRPLLEHPSVLKARRQLKFVGDRFRKKIIPAITGEYPPSELSSYVGSHTGFTTTPRTARSQLSSVAGDSKFALASSRGVDWKQLPGPDTNRSFSLPSKNTTPRQTFRPTTGGDSRAGSVAGGSVAGSRPSSAGSVGSERSVGSQRSAMKGASSAAGTPRSTKSVQFDSLFPSSLKLPKVSLPARR